MKASTKMKMTKVLTFIAIFLFICTLTCCGSKKDGDKNDKKASKEDKIKAAVEEINDAISNFGDLESGVVQFQESRTPDAKAKQASGIVKVLFEKIDGKMSYIKEIYDFEATSPSAVSTTGAITPMELNLLTNRISNDQIKQISSVKVTEKKGKKTYVLKLKVEKDNHTYYGNESFELIKSTRTYVVDKKGILIHAKKEEHRENVYEKAPTEWRLVDMNIYLTVDAKISDYKLAKAKESKKQTESTDKTDKKK